MCISFSEIVYVTEIYLKIHKVSVTTKRNSHGLSNMKLLGDKTFGKTFEISHL